MEQGRETDRCDFCDMIFFEGQTRVSMPECVNPDHKRCDLDKPDCERYVNIACVQCHLELEA